MTTIRNERAVTTARETLAKFLADAPLTVSKPARLGALASMISVALPKGSPGAPVSDEELEEKIFACAGTRTERAREKQAREAVVSLARADSLNELHSALD